MGNLNMQICVKKSNGSPWKNGTIMEVRDGNIFLNGSLISPHVYNTFEDINNCFLCEFEEFEDVEDVEDETKQSPKDSLLELSKIKRIVVELADGRKGIILSNGDVVNDTVWLCDIKNNYNDNLENNIDNKYDIAVVYSSMRTNVKFRECLDREYLTVLWKRELPKYTLKELYKKVGHKFELQD